MRTLDRIKASSEKILSVGRDKVSAIRRDRQQQLLLTQLGRAYYDQRSGTSDADTEAEIDRLIAELSSIDESVARDETIEDDTSATEID